MIAAMQVARSALAAGGLAATSLLSFCTPPGSGPAEPVPVTCGTDGKRLDGVGLTANGSLVCFDDKNPAKEVSLGRVVGLGDEQLVGIDFRAPFTDPAGVRNGVPAGGALYGLGSGGGVYTIAIDDADTSTAVATRRVQLDQTLAGSSFGIDFNPTVDRLRIVSDTGQNLRANVDTGVTLVDGSLNTLGVATNGVVAAAYTNNDTDPFTGTTLYDIDATLDQVVLQSPPNAGGLTPVGLLGADTGPAVGFDLYSSVREVNGGTTTVDVTGWASLDVGGVTGLYSITPFSGRASLIGSFDVRIVDIAIPLQQ